MQKPTKYHLVVCVVLMLVRCVVLGQYTGGSADGFAANTLTLTTCGTPNQFYAYMGGQADGFAAQTLTLTTCSTPTQFYAYMGGQADGFAAQTLTLTTCSTPTQFYAYMGGQADGFAAQTLTLTTCSTPTQFYAYMGGQADGFAAETLTLTTCGTPAHFYAYMGGQADGFARDTFNLCPTTPPVASFTASPTTICAGDTVFFTDQSTNSPFDWQWTFQGGTPATDTLQNPAVVYNTPGTYSVSLAVFNAMGGDTVIATNYITVNAIPAADAGANVAICAGSSTTLTATGGTSYTWTPAAGLSATNIAGPVANPTATTSYSVTVTDNGCSATDVVTVTVNPMPVANAGSDVTICSGSTTTLTASGGTTYIWTPASGLSATNIANPVASPTNTITYTVTVTSNGCSSTDNVLVTVNTLPTASAGSDTAVCNGASTNLSASGGVSYNWSPAAGLSAANISNPVATPSVATDYTVTVTDSNNCQASDAVLVTVNPLPAANAGSDVTICTANSATLTATGGTSYTWTPAAGLSATNISNPVASPTATTTYTVLVTDNNNCQASDDITVTVTSALVANAGSDVSVCIGSPTNLAASGGTTYTWTPSTGLSATNISNPVANPTVTTTYTVIAMSGGCSDSDEVVVTVNPVPIASISASGPTTFCAGDSVVLTASAGASYLWSNNATSQSITVTASGSYAVTVTNSFSCSASSAATTVTVNSPSAASITANGPTTFCQGGSVLLTANTASSYTWSTGANTQTVSITASGTYSVDVTDVFNCGVTSATIAVTVNPNPATPTITVGGNTSLCFGDTVMLVSSTATSYSWNTGSTNDTIIVTAAGVYSVTVFDSLGCSSTSSGLNVTLNDPLSDFTGSPLLVFIPNAAVSFTANVTGIPPYTYTWNFGDGNTSGAAAPTHTYAAIGYYTVSLTVTDSAGCSKTITKNDYVEVEQLFPSTPMVTGTMLNLTSVSFIDAVTGIISLNDGNCILSTDSGNTWTPLPTGNANPLFSAFVMPGDWFTSGANGTILESTNNGLTWTPFSTGTTETFNGIHLSSVTSGFAVGTNGVIYAYNGTNWSSQLSGTSNALNNVYALSNGNAFAAGDNQTILFYNGSAWLPQTCPLAMDVKDIRFTTTQLGYAVGTNGNILQTTDGGLTWNPSLTGVDINFNSVEAIGPDSAWATGTHGIVYTTIDAGANWVRYSVGYTDDQSSLRVTGGRGHVVGQGGNGRNFSSTGGTPVFDVSKDIRFLGVYPNPAKDYCMIKGKTSSNEPISFEVKDVQGRLLERVVKTDVSGEISLQLNTSAYMDGVYFVHIEQGKRSWVQKIVVAR